MTMKKYKLQITTSITSEPKWIIIYADSKTEAQNKYWAQYPTHFITQTDDLLYHMKYNKENNTYYLSSHANKKTTITKEVYANTQREAIIKLLTPFSKDKYIHILSSDIYDWWTNNILEHSSQVYIEDENNDPNINDNEFKLIFLRSYEHHNDIIMAFSKINDKLIALKKC